MTVLLDTSIWVDYLTGRSPAIRSEIDRLLAAEEVGVCGPVIAELLAGTPPERREDLWLALGSLAWAELDHAAWRRVGEVAADLRRRGESLPLTDVEIAVACIGSDWSLWTGDQDFDRIGSVLPGLRRHEAPGGRVR